MWMMWMIFSGAGRRREATGGDNVMMMTQKATYKEGAKQIKMRRRADWLKGEKG